MMKAFLRLEYSVLRKKWVVLNSKGDQLKPVADEHDAESPENGG